MLDYVRSRAVGNDGPERIDTAAPTGIGSA